MQVEVLERGRVLRQHVVSVSNNGHVGTVTAVAATPLGLDFYATCLGIVGT